MKLIYRALQIETTPVQAYVKPRAINWRFQPAALLPSEAWTQKLLGLL